MIRRLLLLAPVLALPACTGGAPAPPAAPSIAVTRPPATSATAPPITVVPTLPAGTPRDRFQALVGQWQAARTAFLSLVTSGRHLSLSAEHAAAATFLAAERRFAAALSPAGWPAAARPALAALHGVSAQMQAHLVAMAQADSPATFTERLADYSVDTARDNAAIRTVDQALAR